MVRPTAQEFISAFIEAFSECYPATPEDRRTAWQNWTAFMTGKQGKAAGYWSERAVLPFTATKLGLRDSHEYLTLDLVMFPVGERWGNLVVVEHENEIGQFKDEVEKLLSVLAPLKVGIVYDYRDHAEDRTKTEQVIENYFSSRHDAVQEVASTEYLFLLGVVGASGLLDWRFASFACSNGPASLRFQSVGNSFFFEEAVRLPVRRSSAAG